MESASATHNAPPASGNGASADGSTIDVHRPVDGSVIRSVAVDSPERVAEVTARVRAAQPEWEAIGFAGRRRWLERLRDWMIENEPRLADVMQEETGKVRAEAEQEAPFLSGTINYYCEHGEEFLAEESPTPHILPLKVKRLRIVYRPYPVVGIISPWNFPLHPRLRRRDPRAHCRLRRRHQALGVHAALGDRARSRMEAGDRRS